jgi:membrane protease YdiL (CAAX protease family)
MAGMAVALLVITAILVICLRFYGRLAVQVVRGEGKVWSQGYELPDILVGGFIAAFFLIPAVVLLFHPSPPEVTVDAKAQRDSAILFTVFVGGVVFFMQSRGLSVAKAFGFRTLPPLRVLGAALLFFAAVYPILRLTVALAVYVLGEQAEMQTIIQFFIDQARQGNWAQLVGPIGAAVIVAPIAEEFLFRGYLYGIVRRYLGPIAAILITSVLFALIHFNLLSFVPLLILAIAFALAYEATGNLFVPMVMHAIFNALNLAEVFYTASRQ